jgi:sugar phosphate isomerase/epimerase
MTSKLSRRRFLARTGAAAAAATLAASAPSRLWAGTALKAGMQLFMVNAELRTDPAGTLAKIAAIGFKEVEPAGFANLTAAQFRKLIDGAGLVCPSAHLAFGVDETARLLDDALALGAHYTISSMLPPRPPSGQGFSGMLQMMNHLTLDDFKRMAQLANQIGEQAHRAGLQYAYHNHNIEFRDYGGETGYSVLLRETDPGLVNFEADCGWMAAGGADPLALMHAHPDRIRLLHFKDFTNLTPPVTDLGPHPDRQITELGSGRIDWKPIVDYGRSIGIEHYIVDQDPPFHGKTAFDAARIDYRFLKPLLA